LKHGLPRTHFTYNFLGYGFVQAHSFILTPYYNRFSRLISNTQLKEAPMSDIVNSFFKVWSIPLLLLALFFVFQAPLRQLFEGKQGLGLPTAEAKNQALTLLNVGDKAPDFNLQASGKKTFTLEGMAGKPFILVFYPMDFTPGCTIQLCALRDKYEQLQKQGVQVLGSNPASVGSHEAFAKVHNYPFPILADTKHTMAKAYGVSHGSSINERTVYIIDKQGKVVYAKRGLPPVEELLNVVETLNASLGKL
jgi:thioredoxin-dependent peroxiredoxin